MLKRPSTRRKSRGEQINLNLVPILDTLVTLIAFLLFTSSFIALVSIESVAPVVASADDVRERAKKDEKPLQLTVSIKDNETEVWSPFNKVPSQRFPHGPEGEPDLMGIHAALIGIKEKFPQETKVVLAPGPGTAYDQLVAVMDTLRMRLPGDPPLFAKDAQGNDAPVKTLFPEVIFGNLLGGS